MSMEIPAALARQLGATHVISVYLPAPSSGAQPRNVFQVVNRCFQILQSQAEGNWRGDTDLVIAPDVGGTEWDGFWPRRSTDRGRRSSNVGRPPRYSRWLSRSRMAPQKQALAA